jgi:hypothetical protein
MLFGLKEKIVLIIWMAIGAGILTTIFTSILFNYIYKINKNVDKLLKR